MIIWTKQCDDFHFYINDTTIYFLCSFYISFPLSLTKAYIYYLTDHRKNKYKKCITKKRVHWSFVRLDAMSLTGISRYFYKIYSIYVLVLDGKFKILGHLFTFRQNDVEYFHWKLINYQRSIQLIGGYFRIRILILVEHCYQFI